MYKEKYINQNVTLCTRVLVNKTSVDILSLLGIQTPVCAVSGAKFLTEDGWTDLRNPTDTDVPFRLFRDEGRTFLQVKMQDGDNFT